MTVVANALSDSSTLDVAMHQQLRGTNRRKRNVIVTGLLENAGVSDETLFLNLHENHLGSKPAVASSLWIGRVTAGEPGRLLV